MGFINDELAAQVTAAIFGALLVGLCLGEFAVTPPALLIIIVAGWVSASVNKSMRKGKKH